MDHRENNRGKSIYRGENTFWSFEDVSGREDKLGKCKLVTDQTLLACIYQHTRKPNTNFVLLCRHLILNKDLGSLLQTLHHNEYQHTRPTLKYTMISSSPYISTLHIDWPSHSFRSYKFLKLKKLSYIYLFTNGSFNDALSTSDYIVWNER
jgi:hypothetical protein